MSTFLTFKCPLPKWYIPFGLYIFWVLTQFVVQSWRTFGSFSGSVCFLSFKWIVVEVVKPAVISSKHANHHHRYNNLPTLFARIYVRQERKICLKLASFNNAQESNVTRCQIYFFIIWLFTTISISPKVNKICQSTLKIALNTK